MKRFFSIYWILLLQVIISCEPAMVSEENEPPQTLKLYSATPNYSQGSVSVQGETNIGNEVEIGMVYGTTPQPAIGDRQVSIQQTGNSRRTLTGTVSNLQPNQRYYFRLYSKKGADVVYSNERNVVLSPNWRQIAAIAYEGQPLAYGFLNEGYGGFSITAFTRTNFASESTGQQWNYYGGVDWQTNQFNMPTLPARYHPIYLPYSDQTTYFFGGGYYYSPEPNPTYTYQKSFDDYRDGPAVDYPGDDVPTIQFGIGANLPDLYVLEVGNGYRLWKYQNRITPTGWELVENAAFPRNNLRKLLAFAAGGKGFVISEDDGSVWAFDPITGQWSARKSLPFKDREKGSALTITKGGVYGLGINVKTGEGYRDLWLYDDKADAWSYLTDYPGEGNANVVAVGRNNRVGFLMGYRATTTGIGTAEFSAARDAWIYEPK